MLLALVIFLYFLVSIVLFSTFNLKLIFKDHIKTCTRINNFSSKIITKISPKINKGFHQLNKKKFWVEFFKIWLRKFINLVMIYNFWRNFYLFG